MKAVAPHSGPSHSLPECGVSMHNAMFGVYLQRRGNDLAVDLFLRQRGAQAGITRTAHIHRSIARSPYAVLTRIGAMPVLPETCGDAS